MMWPFTCPVCHAALAETDGSLRCENRHTYDIAKQGYVNLLRKKPENIYEDKALFAARRAVYEAGFFAPMVEALAAWVPAGGTILDAGCGEGSLLAQLAGSASGIGLDIARPAVQMAAKTYPGYAWCVGDLCAIPLADGTLDAVINVLTPANYMEFLRVLKPEGVLLKAVPGAGHLREIRERVGLPPYAQTLQETVDVLQRHFSLENTQHIQYVKACDEKLAGQVFTMTPLTARQGPVEMPAGGITVDIHLLVARRT